MDRIPPALDLMIGLSGRTTREHSRAGRFDDITFNGGIMRLERRRATGERSARPREIAESVDLISRLRKDFRRRVEEMRPEVAEQMELIGTKRPPLAHYLPRSLLNALQIPAGNLPWLRRRQLIHQHHLRSQGPHHSRPFD